MFSDHKVVKYRSTKSLTADGLDDVIPKLPYVRDPNSLITVDLTTLVSKYNTTLEKIYNDLAPTKSRWITHRPHTPWYNDDLRLAERMFRKTGLEVHKYLQRHVTNTKNNWSFINRPITNLRSNELEETSFFEWSTNCFNLAAHPFLPIHPWKYWLKILTNSLSGKSNPLEMNSRTQSTTHCNLNVSIYKMTVLGHWPWENVENNVSQFYVKFNRKFKKIFKKSKNKKKLLK